MKKKESFDTNIGLLGIGITAMLGSLMTRTLMRDLKLLQENNKGDEKMCKEVECEDKAVQDVVRSVMKETFAYIDSKYEKILMLERDISSLDDNNEELLNENQLNRDKIKALKELIDDLRSEKKSVANEKRRQRDKKYREAKKKNKDENANDRPEQADN